MEVVSTFRFGHYKVQLGYGEWNHPNDCDDNVQLIADHRQFNVTSNAIKLTTNKYLMDYKNPDIDPLIAIEGNMYYKFSVKAYIHSGVKLYLISNINDLNNSDKWDTSIVGVIIIRQDSVNNEIEACSRAETFINEWNDYLNTTCYGWRLNYCENLEFEHDYDFVDGCDTGSKEECLNEVKEAIAIHQQDKVLELGSSTPEYIMSFYHRLCIKLDEFVEQDKRW